MEEFIACFSEVSDPRQENVRHKCQNYLTHQGYVST